MTPQTHAALPADVVAEAVAEVRALLRALRGAKDAYYLTPRLDRLAFLLGLSDMERAFVRAARHPQAARGGAGAADAVTTLLTFADWLDEQGREGDLFRRLVPAEGDVLVFRVPKGGRHPSALRNTLLLSQQVDEHLRAIGRPCLVQVTSHAQRLEHLDPQEMARAGWMQVSEHRERIDGMKASLDGEPEGRAPGLHLADALLAMIGRLKRENAELRRLLTGVQERSTHPLTNPYR